MDRKVSDFNNSKQQKGKKKSLFADGLFRKRVEEDSESHDFDEGDRKSRSSMDVRSADDSPQSISRRKKFFNSFRRKFRSGKTKDKNENLKHLSRSQPNILHSTPNSEYMNLEYDHEPSAFRRKYETERDSFDRSLTNTSVTPVRSRSQSQNTRPSLTQQTSDYSTSSMTPPRVRSLPQHASLQQQSSFSDTSLTPPRSRSQSQHASLPQTSSEEWDREENDSAIEVVEISQNTQESSLLHRHHVHMQHPFHQLEVWLQEGRNLVVRDSCGTSDPYVKFKIGSKQVYKSRVVYKNLNPRWDERFVISVEDVFAPVQVKVYDSDRVTDDPMGSAILKVSDLLPNEQTDLDLHLSDKGSKKVEEDMGYIKVQVKLVPKTQEEKEQGSSGSESEYFEPSSTLSKTYINTLAA